MASQTGNESPTVRMAIPLEDASTSSPRPRSRFEELFEKAFLEEFHKQFGSPRTLNSDRVSELDIDRISELIQTYPKSSEKQVEDDGKEEIVLIRQTRKENRHDMRKLLEVAKKIGGLTEISDDAQLDIPRAREFCLEGSKHKDEKIKRQFLDTLSDILERDPVIVEGSDAEEKKEPDQDDSTSSGLVELAEKCVTYYDRRRFTKLPVPTQKKLLPVFSNIAELIQKHYAAGLINGVTEELKTLLRETLKEFDNLNRREDPELTYEIALSKEGFERIVSDNIELISALQAIGNIISGVSNLADHNLSEAANGFMTVFNSFNMTEKWYDQAMLLKNLGSASTSNPELLFNIIDKLTTPTKPKKRHVSTDWKIVMDIIKTLRRLAMFGETPEIQQQAIDKLLSFVEYNKLKNTTNVINRVKHLEMPDFNVDPNPWVQEYAKVCLGRISFSTKNPEFQERLCDFRKFFILPKRNKNPARYRAAVSAAQKGNQRAIRTLQIRASSRSYVSSSCESSGDDTL